MTLNIPLSELTKNSQGSPFYTIKPILKKKWDKSKLSEKIIKQKGDIRQYKILEYSVFKNIDTLFDFFDYNLFNVGKTKTDVVKYYRRLYGKAIIKDSWLLVVFKLRQL